MALYDAMDGYRTSAPAYAVRLLERAHFVNSHPGWTYADYDAARPADIWFDGHYRAIIESRKAAQA